MTVSAPSPKFITARWFGGPQEKIKWVVLHSTVTPCVTGEAEKVAHFFATEDNKTSAHYVVDPTERRQCVPDHRVAYHCGYNDGSIGVEMCDDPSDKRGIARWDDTPHRQLEVNAAHLVARLCLVNGVRPYYVGFLALRLGVSGVTTHKQMSLAFKKSTHWDPGAWRRFRFMRTVRKHYRYLKRHA
jgi:N-acetylmuramoyl-L-alanine amidase CwlA